MKNDKVKTVAVIPAFNEESSVAKVILRTKPYVDEIIVCDDGSMDMTFYIAKALGARVVRHDEKRGKGEALKTLFREAMRLNPEILVTLDGDDQHDPDAIPMLIKPLEAGKCDIVVGSRYVDGGKMNASAYRRWGLKAINFLYRKFANIRVRDTQSGFRAYSRKTIKYLMQHDAQGYGIEGEQLAVAAKNGLKVMEVPISVNYKQLTKNSKKSSLLHGAELMSTLLRLVTEERPLMYLGLPGIGLTCAGVIMGLYVVWMFNMTRYFSMPVATLTVGSSIGGLLLIIASITLHGLKRIRDRIDKVLDS
jgi:glycosyltransferase involved in cell wall biosynthesis